MKVVSSFKLGALGVTVVAILGFGSWYFHYSKLYPSTEDAYVNSNSVHIATQVSGKVGQVFVRNYQKVKKGQLLFTIEATAFVYELNKAKANLSLDEAKASSLQEQVKVAEAKLEEAQANLFVAKQNNNRLKKLVADQQASEQSGDEALGNYQSMVAAVAAARESLLAAKRDLIVGQQQVGVSQAMLDEAKLNLSYTKVYAPSAGYLVQFFLRPGSMVSQGVDVSVLVENQNWWVDANYKETQLQQIHAGQSAKIILDMYPDVTFKGKVLHVSRGAGSSFSLLPPENASGNWVKVIQRYPVKIQITHNPNPSKYPLRVGASADVTVLRNVES